MKGGGWIVPAPAKVVYGNTRTTVHSTKQRKGRGLLVNPGPKMRFARWLLARGVTQGVPLVLAWDVAASTQHAHLGQRRNVVPSVIRMPRPAKVLARTGDVGESRRADQQRRHRGERPRPLRTFPHEISPPSFGPQRCYGVRVGSNHINSKRTAKKFGTRSSL